MTSVASCYYELDVKERLSLMPCWIGKLEKAMHTHLSGHVLQYLRTFEGALISYSQPVILQQKGVILDDGPHIQCDVRYKAFVFRPKIGRVLTGVVNNIGIDHIGCLVDNYFNAAVHVHKDHTKKYASREDIAVGDRLLFTVSGIDTVGGILSLQGQSLKTGRTLKQM